MAVSNRLHSPIHALKIKFQSVIFPKFTHFFQNHVEPAEWIGMRKKKPCRSRYDIRLRRSGCDKTDYPMHARHCSAQHLAFANGMSPLNLFIEYDFSEEKSATETLARRGAKI